MTLVMSIKIIAIILPLTIFSGIAFWKPNPILFILTGAIAIFTGLEYYNITPTNFGLAIGLSFVVYALYSWALAFRMMFYKEE